MRLSVLNVGTADLRVGLRQRFSSVTHAFSIWIVGLVSLPSFNTPLVHYSVEHRKTSSGLLSLYLKHRPLLDLPKTTFCILFPIIAP